MVVVMVVAVLGWRGGRGGCVMMVYYCIVILGDNNTKFSRGSRDTA